MIKIKTAQYCFFLISIFIIQLSTLNTISQTSIIWENSYGGSDKDNGTSVAPTFDGGYIMVGFTQSDDGDVSSHIGGNDYWIVKIDSVGNIEWDKTYGGSGNDRAVSVVQSNDSGYVISGTTSSHDGDVTGNHSFNMMDFTDYWVIKLNQSGNIIWKKCFGGSEYDQSSEIIKDVNGDYVIAGTSLSSDGNIDDSKGDGDVWIVKIDDYGNIIWKKSYGGTSLEQAWSIANTNNGYIIAGSSGNINGDVTANYGSADAWLVRIDYNGNIIWQKSYGGSNSDQAFAVVQDDEYNFYVSCNSASSDGMLTQNYGSEDFWIFKTDSAGTLLWQRSFGSPSLDESTSICLADSGGCIVTGYFSIVNNFVVTDQSYWILRLDENGNLYWADTLGGSNYDIASSIKQLGDNEYVILGQSSSNDGDVSNHHNSTCGSLPDFWMVKLLDLNMPNNINNIKSKSEAINIVPNPFSNSFKIIQSDNKKISEIYILDLLGKQIYYSKINAIETSINTSILQNDCYLLKVVFEDGSSEVKKLIKN